MINLRKPVALLVAAASVAGLLGSTTAGAETIKAVMNSDLKILDPIWTTAYVQRGFGYLVWDTLFALDEKLQVQPQMVDKWEVSPDKLTWTFTLRDGLVWSDGTPVTAGGLHPVDQALGRPGFDGPEDAGLGRGLRGGRRQDLQDEDEGAVRPGAGIARQAVGQRALHDAQAGRRDRPLHPDQGRGRDRLGSVHLHRQGEWKPGEKVVFVKNPTYKPRAEPPSGLAGGKVAKVDRLEWIWIPDAQTAGGGPAERRGRHARAADARPAAADGQGQEPQAAQRQSAGQPVCAALQHAVQAVRQSQDPPCRHGRLQPGGFPQGHDRRSEILQAVQGGVRLRHAAGQRRGHGRRAERQRRQGQAAPAGGGLRRHAGRAACSRPTSRC